MPLPPIAAQLLVHTLAQGGVGSAIGWSLVLIVFVVIAFLGVMRLRQWLQSDDEPAPRIGFTLSDLRQLHREGKMTDEEFEKARDKMVAGAKAMAAKLPDPLAGRRTRPQPPPGEQGEPDDLPGTR